MFPGDVLLTMSTQVENPLLRTRSSLGGYKCFCGKEFKREAILRRHAELSHVSCEPLSGLKQSRGASGNSGSSSNIIKRSAFRCELCYRSFANTGSLSAHRQVHKIGEEKSNNTDTISYRIQTRRMSGEATLKRKGDLMMVAHSAAACSPSDKGSVNSDCEATAAKQQRPMVSSSSECQPDLEGIVEKKRAGNAPEFPAATMETLAVVTSEKLTDELGGFQVKPITPEIDNRKEVINNEVTSNVSPDVTTDVKPVQIKFEDRDVDCNANDAYYGPKVTSIPLFKSRPNSLRPGVKLENAVSRVMKSRIGPESGDVGTQDKPSVVVVVTKPAAVRASMDQIQQKSAEISLVVTKSCTPKTCTDGTNSQALVVVSDLAVSTASLSPLTSVTGNEASARRLPMTSDDLPTPTEDIASSLADIAPTFATSPTSFKSLVASIGLPLSNSSPTIANGDSTLSSATESTKTVGSTSCIYSTAAEQGRKSGVYADPTLITSTIAPKISTIKPDICEFACSGKSDTVVAGPTCEAKLFPSEIVTTASWINGRNQMFTTSCAEIKQEMKPRSDFLRRLKTVPSGSFALRAGNTKGSERSIGYVIPKIEEVRSRVEESIVSRQQQDSATRREAADSSELPVESGRYADLEANVRSDDLVRVNRPAEVASSQQQHQRQQQQQQQQHQQPREERVRVEFIKTDMTPAAMRFEDDEYGEVMIDSETLDDTTGEQVTSSLLHGSVDGSSEAADASQDLVNLLSLSDERRPQDFLALGGEFNHLEQLDQLDQLSSHEEVIAPDGQPLGYRSFPSATHTGNNSKKNGSQRNRRARPNNANSSLEPGTASGDSFPCYVCGKTFATEKYLSMHISLHGSHDKLKGDSPEVLDMEVTSGSEIDLKSKNTAPREGGWICKLCNREFAHNSGYKNHMRTHSNERPYKCELCVIGFKEKYHLKKHNLYKHSKEMPMQCKHCDKRFKDSTAVRAHERIHSEKRPFPCKRCGKRFKTSECLWHHEHRSKSCGQGAGDDAIRMNALASKRKQYDTIVNSSTNLTHLIPQDTGPADVKISLPDGSYLTTSLSLTAISTSVVVSKNGESVSVVSSRTSPPLSESTVSSSTSSPPPPPQQTINNFVICPRCCRMVSESQPHVCHQELSCPKCSLVFPDPIALSKHEKLHTEDRPYICKICNEGFKMKVHLKKHNSYKHSDEKPFECKFCGKCFKDSSAVKLHERTHLDDRPYECNGCDKAFKTSENLWNHRNRGKCVSSTMPNSHPPVVSKPDAVGIVLEECQDRNKLVLGVTGQTQVIMNPNNVSMQSPYHSGETLPPPSALTQAVQQVVQPAGSDQPTLASLTHQMNLEPNNGSASSPEQEPDSSATDIEPVSESSRGVSTGWPTLGEFLSTEADGLDVHAVTQWNTDEQLRKDYPTLLARLNNIVTEQPPYTIAYNQLMNATRQQNFPNVATMTVAISSSPSVVTNSSANSGAIPSFQSTFLRTPSPLIKSEQSPLCTNSALLHGEDPNFSRLLSWSDETERATDVISSEVNATWQHEDSVPFHELPESVISQF